MAHEPKTIPVPNAKAFLKSVLKPFSRYKAPATILMLQT